MGTVITKTTCDTGITLHWEGDAQYPTEYVHIDTPTGPLGPLPTSGTIDADPTSSYTVNWWSWNSTHDEIVVVGSESVITPALLTNCELEPTTVPPVTQLPAPQPTMWTPPETTLPGPTVTCTPQLTCPTTTAPAAVLDQGVTACNQTPGACVAEIGTPPTLPATGAASDGATIAGVLLVVAGVVALLTRRIGRAA